VPYDRDFGKTLVITAKTQPTKGEMNKSDFIKIKYFWSTK
jgi:hypothetical protein